MNLELTVKNLRKAFPTPAGARLEVLRDVSFAVAAGELVAITGASGAGKSTLLHIIGGLEAADSGSVALGGMEITRANGSLMARYHRSEVGFVFQFHHLLPDLSAAENVALPLLINRTARREAMRRAANALEEMNLGAQARHPVSQLSGGEQQRVAVARALITEPRLLLADEPTGNLDAHIGDEIGSLLAAYCRTHQAAIIIATHNERLAASCDRLLHLREGKIKQESESGSQKSE
ncbi:MAG TPA: ABC transporter ATP-binding protein [Pyrinomonadaceae bacterium]